MTLLKEPFREPVRRRPAARVAGLIAALLATTLLPGCTSPDAVTNNPSTLRDSAGVTIAETPGPIWDADPRWRTSVEPTLRIGAVEGDELYLFSGIRGPVELEDGRVVVADGGSNSLRWYDAQGRFLFERGGAGDGPGEFSFLGALTRASGDTIVATDPGQRRITVFAPDGALVETVEVEGLLAPPGAAYRLTDGTFVLGSGGFSSRQIDEWEPGLHRAPEPLVRLGGGLPGPDTVGTFPGPEMYFRTTDWAVFDHDGGSRGVAVLPAGFSLRDVRDDRVLGSWRDELDVEYVVAYGLLPTDAR